MIFLEHKSHWGAAVLCLELSDLLLEIVLGKKTFHFKGSDCKLLFSFLNKLKSVIKRQVSQK